MVREFETQQSIHKHKGLQLINRMYGLKLIKQDFDLVHPINYWIIAVVAPENHPNMRSLQTQRV